MNYIDRKSIALERYFARRSELLSHLDDMTEDELRQAASDLFPLKRLMLAIIIRDSLRFLQDEYQLGEYIPENILSAAKLSVFQFVKDGHFSDFLLWLRGIHLHNAQARVPWECSLKTAASRLKAPADTFLRSFFSLSNQRIFITMDGNTMTVTPAEREWGRTSVHFTDCRFDAQPPMPLPGFAVAAEADLSDKTRIGMSILVDTHFGSIKTDFSDRLLSDEGWQTVSFSCSDILLDADFVDYAERMLRCGAAKAEIVFDCCRILLNKRLLIGTDGLNSRERALMPIVSLIGAADALTASIQSDKSSLQPVDFADWQYEDLILDSLSNRCVMQSFIDVLRKYGCEDLAAVLEKAAKESFEDHEKEALAAAKLFGIALNKKAANGTLRPLLHHLWRDFSDASSLNTGITDRLAAENLLISHIEKQLLPEMSKLGFSGGFPDFRRETTGKTDYISIMLERRSDRLTKGIVTYSATVAAAEIEQKRLEDYAKFGVKPENVTALDSLTENYDISHYGELCDRHDGGPAMFDLDFYSGDEVMISHEDSRILKKYIAAADYQLQNGQLPPNYRRRLPLSASLDAFGRAFISCLPIAVSITIALLAAYLLFGEALMTQPPSRPAAALTALAIGTVFNCIAGAVRCAVRSRKLWRY